MTLVLVADHRHAVDVEICASHAHALLSTPVIVLRGNKREQTLNSDTLLPAVHKGN